MLFRRLALVLFFVVVGFLVLLSTWGSWFYTDFLWFQSLGKEAVFWKRIITRWTLGAAVGIPFAIILFVGLRFALRASFRRIISLEGSSLERIFSERGVSILLVVVSAAVGFAVGLTSSGNWLTFQTYLHRQPFNISDPIFGKDVGFYVFELPIALFSYQLAAFLLILVIIGALAIFAGTGSLVFTEGRLVVQPPARRYLGFTVGLYLLLKSWGYVLLAYRLMYSPRGAVFGPSYTDVHGALPAARILVAVAFIGALLCFYGGYRRRLQPVLVALGLLMGFSILGGTIYPSLLQQFSVSPNEIAKENRYISENIRFTRLAYGLNDIKEKEFPALDSLTPEDVRRNRDTVDNVRLWDWKPLLQTYSQLQEMRPYYNFVDVDVDRYFIDGRLRQALISAREMNQDRLPDQAKTWVNQRLKYTHGYGAVMSPANEFTSEGLPVLWLKNLPPESEIGLEVKRPEIYFGERTREYVIVNTREPEFDYPVGDVNRETTYQGKDGVNVGSLTNRLAFAFRYSSYRILFSGAIKGDSRILFDRDIGTRVRKIAPFLIYDPDPYVVLSNGRLFWVQDAYVVSDGYPYAQPFFSQTHNRSFNYIRNSVKVVIDAYNGDVTFYAIDPSDPVLKSYMNVFPGLFEPAEKMPEDIVKHIRYPEFLFSVQSRMYATYHMEDPVVFYNREDAWSIPTEKVAGKEEQMAPYYVIMRLPGEESPEFMLILPFTPARKQNMIAWLAARCDEPHYGQLLVYKFPKQRLVYGPIQIEARIDQDTFISQQLTLWGQRGSEVLRGNLLVIPIETSLLYVEPLYLVATENQLPELKRVIVSYGGHVIMERDLSTALGRIFGTDVTPPETPTVVKPPSTEVSDLVTRANELLNEASRRAGEGDWTGYGEALRRLRDTLKTLEERVRQTMD